MCEPEATRAAVIGVTPSGVESGESTYTVAPGGTDSMFTGIWTTRCAWAEVVWTRSPRAMHAAASTGRVVLRMTLPSKERCQGTSDDGVLVADSRRARTHSG